MSIYKGTQLISGVATPIEAGRNIGQIIQSLLPITDAGLHLLDGTLISGNGIYKSFVEYISKLDLTASYFMQPLLEEDWTQPVATANSITTQDGLIQISASSQYSTEYQPYNAMNGSTSGNSWSSTGSTASAWWQVKFPYKIKITGLTFYSASNTGYCAKNCRFYTSATKATPIGDAFVGATAANTSTTVTGIPTGGIITDTIYLDITSSHGSGVGMGELVITATKPPQTAEDRWQESVSKYGVCGKFVYDANANTVRLPKVTGILEGTIDTNALGDLVEAGLPNIPQHRHSPLYVDGTSSDVGDPGQFILTDHRSGIGIQTNTNGYTGNYQLTSSSDVYGNSDTVQPQAIKGYYYIVIATSAKTDIEVDIDNVATDLNSKADMDLTNTVGALSSSAKEYFTKISLPSDRYINLTLGATGTTYTAPSDGYIYFMCKLRTAGARYFVNCYGKTGDTVYGTLVTQAGSAAISSTLPVKNGDDFKIGYDAYDAYTFRFVYAQGSESEA